MAKVLIEHIIDPVYGTVLYVVNGVPISFTKITERKGRR